MEDNYIANLSVNDCPGIITNELAVGLHGFKYDMWVVGGQQFGPCIDFVLNDGRFDHMKILHLAGAQASARVAIAFPGIHEVRFLQGMLCAQASETQVVGYVTSFPFSNTIISRTLSAFVLGAKYVNPDIRVVLGLTESFFSPVAETKATEKLIAAGADCIAQQQNDLTVHHVTSQRKIWSIGYITDSRFFIDESVLSSINAIWEPLILQAALSVINDSWVSDLRLEAGYSVGSVELTGYSTDQKFDGSWRTRIDEIIPSFQNGSLNIFCTPLFDDPQWIVNSSNNNSNSTYKANDGNICLTERGLSDMRGVIRDAQILVHYNDTNSPYVVIWVKWTSPGAIILCVITGILIIASLLSMFDVLYNRDTPVYRAASPMFCMLILAGITIACIAPFLWIGYRTKYNCMAPWWVLGIGFALIFSCLLAKNWRIWRIFSSGHFRVVAIMNSQLLYRWVGIIVFFELIILILWTILDPQRPASSQAPELKFDEVQLICTSKSGKTIGLGVFLAYNVLLLFPLALISYWTRVAKEEYRETRAIAMIVFSSVIICLISIAIVAATPHNYTIFFYLAGYSTWLILTIVYTNLFLPKTWRVHFAHSGISEPNTNTGVSVLHSQTMLESVTSPSMRGRRRPSFTAPITADNSITANRL
jgi:basic membrane lipoprotein Med (substrate-binding protein (PBP1-ABC) superfamily)